MSTFTFLGTLHARQSAGAFIYEREALDKTFAELAERYKLEKIGKRTQQNTRIILMFMGLVIFFNNIDI